LCVAARPNDGPAAMTLSWGALDRVLPGRRFLFVWTKRLGCVPKNRRRSDREMTPANSQTANKRTREGKISDEQVEHDLDLRMEPGRRKILEFKG
jgi:hypothetical protein